MIAPLSAENKFLGSPSLYGRIISILAHFCRPDRQYPQNRVFSIYYDTPAHTAYEEKENGTFLKQKVRLRWYEDIPASKNKNEAVAVYLECKNKVGGIRGKLRKSLKVDRAQLYTAPMEGSWFQSLIADHFCDIGLPSPGRWSPSIQIDYLRDRYECPVSGARICVDYQIGCGRVNRQMLPEMHALHLNTLVVEIKGIHNPDTPWLKHIYATGLRFSSFSKYGICFEKVSGGMLDE